MASFLAGLSINYIDVAKMLGVEKPPEFTWDGYSVENWMSDLRLRITKIQIVAEKKKLESLEDRLNKIISPKKRAELELEAIANELQ